MELSAPPLRAVVLTGTRKNQNALLEGTGLHNKVLLPVGGQPMVLSVLKNIAATKYQPEIFVSTDDDDIKALQNEVPFQTLPSENKAIRSFLKSLERLPADTEWALFVSGDHPLLTSEMIEYFVDEAKRRNLSIAAAVVNGTLVKKHYPDSKRTYFSAKDGLFSGGNMYLVHKPSFLGNTALFEAMDENRKRPWKTVLMLDIVSIIQIALRRLDMNEIAKRASRFVGCSCGFIIMPFAECCMDVDKPSDRDIANRILAKRRQSAASTQADSPSVV